MDDPARPPAARRSARLLAAVGAILLATGAVALWLTAADAGTAPALVAPAQAAASVPDLPAEPVEDDAPLLAPAAAPLTREEKRFRRTDRNDDGRIQQSEYLHLRRRNFDKLDTNGDGRLSFEEYAAAGIRKFTEADRSKDGVLSAAEYATTAPKPRAPTATASRQCPPCALAQAED